MMSESFSKFYCFVFSLDFNYVGLYIVTDISELADTNWYMPGPAFIMLLILLSVLTCCGVS